MIRKLHKCAISDCNFYWNQTSFDAQFVFWKNGAYAAYIPVEIANEMIGIDFDNLVDIDGHLFVSTKELHKFITNYTITKIEQHLHLIKPAVQKYYHVA